MSSHKKMSGLELTLGKGGLRFKKRKSGFNVCIGKQLVGLEGPTHGGRYDKAWQAKFTAAVEGCRGKLGRVM